MFCCKISAPHHKPYIPATRGKRMVSSEATHVYHSSFLPKNLSNPQVLQTELGVAPAAIYDGCCRGQVELEMPARISFAWRPRDPWFPARAGILSLGMKPQREEKAGPSRTCCESRNPHVSPIPSQPSPDPDEYRTTLPVCMLG
jgi:hypothetical protein